MKKSTLSEQFYHKHDCSFIYMHKMARSGIEYDLMNSLQIEIFFLFLCYRNVNKGVNFATLLGIIIFRKGFNFMLMTVLQNIIQEL